MPPSHSHAHGHDPEAPPPSPSVRRHRRRAVWLMMLLLVPVAVATVIGLVLLWPGGAPTRAQQVADKYLPPGSVTYVQGQVATVTTHLCPADPSTPKTICAATVVKIMDGTTAGSYQQLELTADVVAAGVAPGDTLVLTQDLAAPAGQRYQFSDFARGTPIVVLAIVFAVVVGLVARLRGLLSLLGLGFAFAMLMWFVVPGLLAGESPTLISLVGSAAIMFVVLYLAHGFSARTTTALVGTLFGLALIAVLGSVAVSVARLTGVTNENTIQLSTFDPTLNFSGLVLAAVVVAGLGVLNDVTITQASAVWQLNEASPDMTWRELFGRGMAIGRDHIASTVYTIVFAYAGAALPLLLVFELYHRPFWINLTSSVVAEEVLRILVGGVALVLAVPVTTALGAFFARAADTTAGARLEAAGDQRLAGLRARLAR